MTDPKPTAPVDVATLRAKLDVLTNATHLKGLPGLAKYLAAIDTVLADLPALLDEVERLRVLRERAITELHIRSNEPLTPGLSRDEMLSRALTRVSELELAQGLAMERDTARIAELTAEVERLRAAVTPIGASPSWSAREREAGHIAALEVALGKALRSLCATDGFDVDAEALRNELRSVLAGKAG